MLYTYCLQLYFVTSNMTTNETQVHFLPQFFPGFNPAWSNPENILPCAFKWDRYTKFKVPLSLTASHTKSRSSRESCSKFQGSKIYFFFQINGSGMDYFFQASKTALEIAFIHYFQVTPAHHEARCQEIMKQHYTY